MKKQLDIPLDFRNTPEELETLCDHVKAFVKECKVPRNKIYSLCLNMPGRVNPISGKSNTLFSYIEGSLADYLNDRLDIDAFIDNDTRAMTYGEMLCGEIADSRNALFVNVSQGTGVGIVIDRKLYIGNSGFAGEYGHFIAFDNEVLCSCGKRGCLETEVSGAALCRVVTQDLNRGSASFLSYRVAEGEPPISFEEVRDAIVVREDELCIDAVEAMGRKLGRNLAGLINLLNPDTVVIGGDIAECGDYFLQPLKSAVRKHSLNLVNNDSRIVFSSLNIGGLIGTCLMARSRFYRMVY